jgi:hypothetical protein
MYWDGIQPSARARRGLEWVDIPTGDVAQLGERLVCNQEVEGSIPFVSTPKSLKNKTLGRGNPTRELKEF